MFLCFNALSLFLEMYDIVVKWHNYLKETTIIININAVHMSGILEGAIGIDSRLKVANTMQSNVHAH